MSILKKAYSTKTQGSDCHLSFVVEALAEGLECRMQGWYLGIEV